MQARSRWAGILHFINFQTGSERRLADAGRRRRARRGARDGGSSRRPIASWMAIRRSNPDRRGGRRDRQGGDRQRVAAPCAAPASAAARPTCDDRRAPRKADFKPRAAGWPAESAARDESGGVSAVGRCARPKPARRPRARSSLQRRFPDSLSRSALPILALAPGVRARKPKPNERRRSGSRREPRARSGRARRVGASRARQTGSLLGGSSGFCGFSW